ncbi:MAG: NAD-dependent epimerase/dehydratase family protein [Pseudomonadota bacterium]
MAKAAGKLRVGLIGAGYIADWHALAVARSPYGELAAVADLSKSAAEAVAAGRPVFTDAGEMLASGAVDAVHILTPPASHAPIARLAIEQGVPALIEKPVTLTAADARELAALAEEKQVPVAVGHNFLALPAYEQMRRAIDAGQIGRLESTSVNWKFPLPPLRSGPFGIWMLREPKNIVLELGAHLVAFVENLAGPLEDISVKLSNPITIPGGVEHWQTWRVLGRAGTADVNLTLSLVEGHDDRSVTVRGVTGMANLDFATNRLDIRRPNASDIVVSDLASSFSIAGQYAAQGMRNAVRQIVSLNKDQPYGLGINRAAAAFHKSVAEGAAVDERFSLGSAVRVMEGLEGIISAASSQLQPPAALAEPTPNPETCDALVIGGTGFIGRALVRALAEQGKTVRVLSRGQSPVFDQYTNVSLVKGSLASVQDIAAAMAGADTVYHLAKAEESSWQAYLQNDVAVTERIAEAAIQAGVKRFVYTGTIDSYSSGDPGQVITEDTSFAADMSTRNLYARSKALCEERLLALHHEKALPLVIARPGIVVGEGGPLQHWGVGRWNGAGAVRIWGEGKTKLPFVLVDDVADGLVLCAETPGIEGESFNLIAAPMLSAREYFAAIGERTGVSVDISPGNPTGFFISDVVKTTLKARLAGMPQERKPTLTDWRARTHASPYDNTKAKERLGWNPVEDTDAFLKIAVDDANLFGF